MRQVNQQNQADEQEEAGADQREVIAPNDEHGVRDEEGEDDHDEPADNFRSPEAVLNGRASIFGGPHSHQNQGHEQVEHAEGEVDPLHSSISIALLSVTLDVHIVEGEVRQLLHGPGREHDPGHDRVYKEEEGVGDASSNAIAALPTGTEDGAAGGSAAARGGDSPYLARRRQFRVARVYMGKGELVHTVPTLGTASSGIDNNAPMVAMEVGRVLRRRYGDGGA